MPAPSGRPPIDSINLTSCLYTFLDASGNILDSMNLVEAEIRETWDTDDLRWPVGSVILSNPTHTVGLTPDELTTIGETAASMLADIQAC